MTREEMLLRHGFYTGIAQRLLNDDSYFRRWFMRADLITEVDYMQDTAEIQSRLVAAGLIAIDEDPYERKDRSYR